MRSAEPTNAISSTRASGNQLWREARELLSPCRFVRGQDFSKAPSPATCRSSRPRRFDPVNRKTADALVLTIPSHLYVADDVIE
jgi:hypothetical protein